MDNSRIISSQKRSREETPGVVAKLRRFISPWSSDARSSKRNVSMPVNSDKSITSNRTDKGNSNRTNSNQNNNISIPGSFSPNKAISTFFQTKGEEPLTENEYENIVSLINKSRNFTAPIGNKQESGSIPRSRPMSRKPSVSTPQRTIKANNSAIFSTPDYTPQYHTIANTSMPSIKRVYQFSGLPSPYRTKIIPPKLNKKRIENETANTTQNNTFTKNNASKYNHSNNNTFRNGDATLGNITMGNTTLGSILENSPSSKRPRSDAANTLLSILDDNDEKKAKPTPTESSVSSFVNPYKSNNRVKRSRVSALDINKTIAFDKSEKLPEETKEASIESKKSEDKPNSSSSSASIPNLQVNSASVFEFVFPVVKPKPATLDEEKVIKYASLFNF